MANTVLGSSRRLSYAYTSSSTVEQKSRRVSYAGQSSLNELTFSNHQVIIPVSKVLTECSSNTVTAKQATPAAESSNNSGSNPNVNGVAMLDGIIINRGMDANRNTRRSNVRSTEESFACSQQSILSAMDRFVKSVNNMDSTVLIPSRLRDMDFDSNVVKGRPPVGFGNPDLFSFYSMLKDVKTELLWGSAMGAASSMLGPLVNSGRSTPRQHSRQPSDDSLGSTGSASDQDTDSDLDSVLTDRDACSSVDEQTSHIAVAFRYHLQGLHSILHQLADSADYLAVRYQAEVDACSL